MDNQASVWTVLMATSPLRRPLRGLLMRQRIRLPREGGSSYLLANTSSAISTAALLLRRRDGVRVGFETEMQGLLLSELMGRDPASLPSRTAGRMVCP